MSFHCVGSSSRRRHLLVKFGVKHPEVRARDDVALGAVQQCPEGQVGRRHARPQPQPDERGHRRRRQGHCEWDAIRDMQ